MIIDFKFSCLLGKPYCQGNIIFTKDGDGLLCPTGNRVGCYQFTKNRSFTYHFETVKDVQHIALSPDDLTLVAIDIEGKSIFVNNATRSELFHFSFGSSVNHVSFSPCGKYLAVAREQLVEIWKTPKPELEVMPMILLWRSSVHNGTVTHVSWSSDSQYLLSSSTDMTIRFYKLSKNQLSPIKLYTDQKKITSHILPGHKDVVVGAWFNKDFNTIYSIGKDCYLYVWKPFACNEKNKNKKNLYMNTPIANVSWKFVEKQSFRRQMAYVASATFQQSCERLVVGLSNGDFFSWTLPNLSPDQTLNATQSKVNAIALNSQGNLIAFGNSQFNQLIVWHCDSESYVVRQQGHKNIISCISYSNDGQFLATGGDDNKVKIWEVKTNLCFTTFSNHTSAVTALVFTKKSKVVFSASLDGTVRAYDLIRYRNFRTFTSPQLSQFSSIDVNQSGEIVCAGSSLGYEIFVWSVQTGKLLEVLSGHEAPLSCLAFNPIDNGVLATASWDYTLRIWTLYSDSDEHKETYKMESDVLSVAFRPDGNVIACSTLKGDIYFWDHVNGHILGIIEGRNHLTPGRSTNDNRKAENKVYDQHFKTICYSSDGTILLAAGNTPYVCLYDTETYMLLKRFKISHNLSLGGILTKLNSKYMTEAGPVDNIDTTGELNDLEDRLDNNLPGAPKKSNDPSKRHVYTSMRVMDIKFSPTSRSWAVATSEGVIIYSLDENPISFDPYSLCIDITHGSVIEAILQKRYLQSLILALRLGDSNLTDLITDCIPFESVELVSRLLPTQYLARTLNVITKKINNSIHLEILLNWCQSLLFYHAQHISENYTIYANSIRAIQNLNPLYQYFRNVCSRNTNDIKYLMFLIDHPEYAVAKSLNASALPSDNHIEDTPKNLVN